MKNKFLITFWEKSLIVVVFLTVVFGLVFPILFEYYNISGMVGLLCYILILFILWLGFKLIP